MRETVPIGYNLNIVARSVLSRYGQLGYKRYLGCPIFLKNDMRKFEIWVLTIGSRLFLLVASEMLYFKYFSPFSHTFYINKILKSIERGNEHWRLSVIIVVEKCNIMSRLVILNVSIVQKKFLLQNTVM